MDTRKLLEELENVINNASEVPLTNKKLVDKDEIERLIDAINQSLPNELESARRIVADKERIMLDAEKESRGHGGAGEGLYRPHHGRKRTCQAGAGACQ